MNILNFAILNAGTIGGLPLMIFMLAAWYYFVRQAERGNFRPLHRMPVLDLIEESVGRAAELGKGVHWDTGYGGRLGLGHFAGLAMADFTVGLCAKYDVPFTITLCWPELIPLTEQFIRREYASVGKDVNPEDMIRFFSTEYWGYGLGAYGVVQKSKPAAVFLGGMLYAECMIMLEGAASVGATTLGATVDGNVTGYTVPCADYYMFPTEIYAAGAFLTGDATMAGSLTGTEVTASVWLIWLVVAVVLSAAGSMGLYNFMTS
jgi:hypothetical protein